VKEDEIQGQKPRAKLHLQANFKQWQGEKLHCQTLTHPVRSLDALRTSASTEEHTVF